MTINHLRIIMNISTIRRAVFHLVIATMIHLLAKRLPFYERFQYMNSKIKCIVILEVLLHRIVLQAFKFFK